MASFLVDIRDIIRALMLITRKVSSTIRSSPYLLFTVGFVVTVYAIIILRRLLSDG